MSAHTQNRAHLPLLRAAPAQVPDDGLVTAEVDPIALENETALEPVVFITPIYVCGDGKRTTNEACDDNNVSTAQHELGVRLHAHTAQ